MILRLLKKLGVKTMTAEEHKEGLRALYAEFLVAEPHPFMDVVLGEALRRLAENNVSPSAVEDWVVKMHNVWESKP